MKFLIVALTLMFSAPAFAVNSGFLSGVVALTGSATTYNVNRSSDNAIRNQKTDNGNVLIFLPAPQAHDTYLIKDDTSDCDVDGYLTHAFCVEVAGQVAQIDGANEECLVACHEGAIYQYDGTQFVDIGDSF